MKRIIISLLCIITVLCGYFLIHKKTALINTRTETNSTQQPSAPSPLEQLKTQFKQPFKGRVFQELVSMSVTQRAYELNSRAISTSDQMLGRLTQL